MQDPAVVLAIMDLLPEFIDPEDRAWWEAQRDAAVRARARGRPQYLATLPTYLRTASRSGSSGPTRS